MRTARTQALQVRHDGKTRENGMLLGHYEVMHHSVFLQQLLDEGKIRLKEGGSFKEEKSPTTTAAIWAGEMVFMRRQEKYWKPWTLSWLK